jgi:ferredoxin-NADP reductase
MEVELICFRTPLHAVMIDLLTTPPAAASVLAFVTTLHLGLAALRNHRRESGGAGLALAAVSLLLSAAPWLLPSIAGVCLGLGVHAVWFAICEWIVAPRPGRPLADIEPTPGVAIGAPRRTTPARAPRAWVDVRVLAVVEETHDIRTFRLARPSGFDFVAGQFLTVRIRVDGREQARCYSISSAPDAAVRAGGTLSVLPPLGSFVYPAADDRPLVLLAGGIGITPLLSMLRHAVAAEPSRPITLLYSARSDADFAFRDELLVLARRHPQVRVHFASSRASTPAVYPGRIDRALLQATVPDVVQSVVCICGPAPMIDAARALLAELGVPASQVRYELFEAAVAAGSGGAAAPHAPPTRDAAVYRMHCAESDRTVPIAAGQSLLDAAEQGQIAIASLCRAGICGTCRVQVTDGDVRCDAASLDPDERARGYVLACVSTATGDCRVQV